MRSFFFMGIPRTSKPPMRYAGACDIILVCVYVSCKPYAMRTISNKGPEWHSIGGGETKQRLGVVYEFSCTYRIIYLGHSFEGGGLSLAELNAMYPVSSIHWDTHTIHKYRIELTNNKTGRNSRLVIFLIFA